MKSLENDIMIYIILLINDIEDYKTMLGNSTADEVCNASWHNNIFREDSNWKY